MIIKLIDSAEDDLVEGHHFYERKTEGLGNYFLDSLFSDITSLHVYAGIHSQHLGYYRLLAKRFPFAVYYRLEEKEIRVYAVLDCRRNPAWIRKKLSSN